MLVEQLATTVRVRSIRKYEVCRVSSECGAGSIPALATKNNNMKERKYLIKIAGQYVVLTEGEYELYLIYGTVK
jgi:hypothetical protein